MKLKIDGTTIRFGLYSSQAAEAVKQIIDSVYMWKLNGMLEIKSYAYRKLLAACSWLEDGVCRFLFKWPHCYGWFRYGPFVYRDMDGEVCLDADRSMFDLPDEAWEPLVALFMHEVFMMFFKEHIERTYCKEAIEICQAFIEDMPVSTELAGHKLDQIEMTAVEVLIDEINRLKGDADAEDADKMAASWQMSNELEKILG